MKRTLIPILVALYSVAQAATITVTTASSAVDPNDDAISFTEALQEANSGDTIAFDIPGPGPHFISTPDGGYPFIFQSGLTIDGYTQPNSHPNTSHILDGNNAVLQIVLDSRNGARRLLGPLGNPGFGDEESCILGVLDANHFTIRGLSFLAPITEGTASDPSIYHVALVDAATDARLQGCWFGLAPDGLTVAGGRAAVANFAGTDGVTAAGLVFGTDGDGANDVAEFNIAIGLTLAIHLQTIDVKVSGNYINVYPDGSTFFDVNGLAESTGADIESIENGRPNNMIIGTDGDGVADEDERNIIGQSVYSDTIEFWRSGTNAVIAGNYFGIGADGVTQAPAPVGASPNFLNIRNRSSIRIGSNGDGVSDDLEGNLFYNIPGARFVALRNDDSGANASKLVCRRNKMVNNGFSRIMFADGVGAPTYAAHYSATIDPSSTFFAPEILDVPGGVLQGTLPPPNLENYTNTIVDVYIIDPQADANSKVQPFTFLGSFVPGSTEDGDPNAGGYFFDLTPFTIPDGAKLAVEVTYYNFRGVRGTEVGQSDTGPMSEAFSPEGQTGEPVPPATLRIEVGGGSTLLTWAAPEFRYRLEVAEQLGVPGQLTPWQAVLEFPNHEAGINTVELPFTAAPRFFRLVSQGSPEE